MKQVNRGLNKQYIEKLSDDVWGFSIVEKDF